MEGNENFKINLFNSYILVAVFLLTAACHYKLKNVFIILECIMQQTEKLMEIHNTLTFNAEGR